MAAEWYYSKGNQQQGPISASELKQMAQSGQLGLSDLVWKEGMDGWKPAASVKGLFPVPSEAQRAAPPALPTTDPQSASNRIQRVAQWFTFGSTLPRPLPFETPWDSDERTAPNKIDLYCAIAAVPVAGIMFFSLLIGLLFPPLLLFALWLGVVLAALIFGRKMWGISDTLRGRWVSAENDEHWVEFLEGGNLRHSDGTTGRWTLIPNGRFIDLAESGAVTDCWKVLDSSGAALEVQDRSGAIHSFKKGKTLAERESDKAFEKLNVFKQSRPQLLVGKWEPVDGQGPAIQFNKDGSMIQFDGFAARYKLKGEPPKERVVLEFFDGNCLELHVASLSKHELVLSSESGAKHYRRGTSVTEEEFRKEMDVLKGRAVTVGKATGKAAVITVGVVGLGLLALAGAGSSSGMAATSFGGSSGRSGGTGGSSGLSRTSGSPALASSPPPQPVQMPTIRRGRAEIENCTATSVKLRVVCERCGTKNTNTTSLHKGGATGTAWMCPQCGHRTDVDVKFA